MARPLRLEFEGAIYHICARGVAREKIFACDDDKAAFLKIMGKVFDRFHWLCYAYCLMDNHYHLVIETREANLSKGMRQLNGLWAQMFNGRNNSAGHVFQSRFFSHVIERESYLLETLRYVALNPVRAQICKSPQEYKFSSYRQTTGLDQPDGLINIDWVLGQFSDVRSQATAGYRQFVKDGVGKESVFDDLKANIFLGSDDFVTKHTLLLADEKLLEIPRIQRPDPKPPIENAFANRTKSAVAEGAHRAHVDWGYSMKQIADYLRVHYSTVSRAIKRYENTPADGDFA